MDFFELLAFGDTGWGDEMLKGALMTVLVSISAMAIGLFVSVFGTMSKMSNNGFVRGIGNTYTTIVRGIPELLVIYLLYFGLNNAVMGIAKGVFGYDQYIELPVFLVAAIAVGLISGAYSTRSHQGCFFSGAKRPS